ncbi:hypothetical protein K2X83_01400 [Patescibacteria group bacterium]|nr:hypothetical protein [Patescibacteria group bacterium]
MDFSFIEPRTIYLIGHLLGIAFGAGGAFISDLLFLKAVRDNKITKTEMGFIELGGYCVTVGLIVLIISGAFLFSLDPERYLASSKFLTKMTVVTVLIANGFLLHAVHIPRMKKRLNEPLSSVRSGRWKLALIASGVLSAVSWVSAIVLGAFKSIPYEYEVLLGVYVAVVVVGVGVAYMIRDVLLPPKKK